MSGEFSSERDVEAALMFSQMGLKRGRVINNSVPSRSGASRLIGKSQPTMHLTPNDIILQRTFGPDNHGGKGFALFCLQLFVLLLRIAHP